MPKFISSLNRAHAKIIIAATLLIAFAVCAARTTLAQQSNAAASTASSTSAVTMPRTPTETVREFYKALRERRFREAFAMSIYKPAIDGLSAEEFDDLRSEFDKMAANVPPDIEISGEQISGDTASVFMKIPGAATNEQPDPVPLMRAGSTWIIGDKDSEKVVKDKGKKFFFEARIDTHHREVQAMLQRIAIVEIVYSQQHTGLFADVPALIAAGLVPKDIEGTDSTGYHFHITLASGGKSYTAGAEPSRYGRTGRLSFFMDQSGIKSADTGGKPLVPAATPATKN